MNDYDLFLRCEMMVTRDSYDNNDIVRKYVDLAKRRFRKTEQHRWMAEAIEEIVLKQWRRAVQGSVRILPPEANRFYYIL